MIGNHRRAEFNRNLHWRAGDVSPLIIRFQPETHISGSPASLLTVRSMTVFIRYRAKKRSAECVRADLVHECKLSTGPVPNGVDLSKNSRTSRLHRPRVCGPQTGRLQQEIRDSPWPALTQCRCSRDEQPKVAQPPTRGRMEWLYRHVFVL